MLAVFYLQGPSKFLLYKSFNVIVLLTEVYDKTGDNHQFLKKGLVSYCWMY